MKFNSLFCSDNLVVIIMFVGGGVGVTYSLYATTNPTYGLGYYYSVAATGFGLCLTSIALLWVSKNIRKVLSKWAVAVLLVLFSSELGIYLSLQVPHPPPTKQAALSAGAEWDQREYLDVVMERRLDDKTVTPFIAGYAIDQHGLQGANGPLFPVGSVPDSATVYDLNLYGEYIVSRQDKYGFLNNVDYQTLDQVDVFLTGNCITEYAGKKYPEEENLTQILASKGLKSLNFSKQGDGLYLQYVKLREFGVHFKPKVVFMTYFSGDEMDRPVDEKSLLGKYLMDPDFSQDLIRRGPEIKEVLTKFVEEKIEERLSQARERDKLDVHWMFDRARWGAEQKLWVKVIKLSHLRQRLGLVPAVKSESFAKHYLDVIQAAKGVINSWGGRLYIIHIPKYSNPRALEHDKRYRDGSIRFLREVEGLDVQVVHLDKEVFEKHENHELLFPWGTDQHPNGDANVLIAEILVELIHSQNADNAKP